MNIQINLGAVYDVSGFRYLPRQDGRSHGRIAQYEFYVSMDGATWGPAVASGTFANTAAEQAGAVHGEVGPVHPACVRMTDVSGQPWTTVAELNVLGTDAAGELPLPISQANWTLHSVDSQETEVAGYAATNAFDGNPNSMWATAVVSAAPPPPHEHSDQPGRGVRRQRLPVSAAAGRVAARAHRAIRVLRQHGRRELGRRSSRRERSRTRRPSKRCCSRRSRAGTSGLRALSEVNGQPWTTVAELNVLAVGQPAAEWHDHGAHGRT